jgi:hypothetical protein
VVHRWATRERFIVSNETLHRISRRMMLGLSLIAMSLVVGATALAMLGRFHPTPDGDEGTAAHLFQLAVALLLPTGLVFLGTADWREPRRVARGLLVPAVALVVAFALVYHMEHLQ